MIEEAKILLTTKLIDTNVPDALRRAPLHLATERSDKDLMELLLNYGANPDAQNEGACLFFCRKNLIY